jgi:hypothetical protein
VRKYLYTGWYTHEYMPFWLSTHVGTVRDDSKTGPLSLSFRLETCDEKVGEESRKVGEKSRSVCQESMTETCDGLDSGKSASPYNRIWNLFPPTISGLPNVSKRYIWKLA